MTKWHPATKLLVGAALLALPYLLWTQPEAPPVAARAVERAPGSDAAGDDPAQDQAPPLEPFVLPPLERFTAVVERPLFSPTRRMPALAEPEEEEAPQEVAQAPEPAAPAGPEEPEVRFFGTVRQGGAAAALVTLPATGEVARLVPGDHVGAWEVLEVERNRLVLGLDDERRTFEIFGSALRVPPAPAPASAGEEAAAAAPEEGDSVGEAPQP